jgi:PPK2 family polyphosphate:nucleotide phosphotransferase
MVRPGTTVKLSKYDPGETTLISDKEQAHQETSQHTSRLVELQELLYAEAERAVLVVLQAMDAGGKDGTIKHVMSGVNPQGCTVTSFKVPSAEEANHDFLWRVHKSVPPRGQIGIFNRSHYEDVLAVRVHNLVPKTIWKARYDQINRFEQLLFLHISKDEQRRRLDARRSDPAKAWKLSPADLAERELWDDYQEAYEDVLTRCSRDTAPWYIVPSDHKWYRDWYVSEVLVDTLKSMKLEPRRANVTLERS